MSEEVFHPGAARYGNFINYYQFNPPEERIKYLPESFIQCLWDEKETFLWLDIGCNAGVSIFYFPFQSLLIIVFELFIH